MIAGRPTDAWMQGAPGRCDTSRSPRTRSGKGFADSLRRSTPFGSDACDRDGDVW